MGVNHQKFKRATIIVFACLLVYFILYLFYGIGFHTVYMSPGIKEPNYRKDMKYVSSDIDVEKGIAVNHKITYFGKFKLIDCSIWSGCTRIVRIWLPIREEDIVLSDYCEIGHSIHPWNRSKSVYELSCYDRAGQKVFERDYVYYGNYQTDMNILTDAGYVLPTEENPIVRIPPRTS